MRISGETMAKKDDKKPKINREHLINCFLQDMNIKEINELYDGGSSYIWQKGARLLKEIEHDLSLPHDPVRDMKQGRNYLELRDKIRNQRIQEGFKSNLLYAVETIQGAINQMKQDPDSISEAGKILKDLNKLLVDIKRTQK